MKGHSAAWRRATWQVAAGAAVAFSCATVLEAQGIDPRCPSNTAQQRVTQDGCQKAIDLFTFMTPQLGVAIVGGNTTLGQGGALGGIGRFSVGLRANGLQGRLPQVQDEPPVVNGARSSDYRVEDQLVGLPAVEAAIGLFKGLPAGPTNILAVDLLASVAYLPEVNESNIDITLPNGALKFGFGGRLGILQESIITPSVAVSYLRRELPDVDIIATSGSDELRVDDVEVKTGAWRLVAGKNLAVLGVAAGVGQDYYESGGAVSVRVNQFGVPVIAGPISIAQDLTRTNYFADVSLNFPLVKLAIEVGRVSGGNLTTFNTFSGKRADDALTYLSLGVRIGF